MNLPKALTEETIRPDHVVITQEDDGSLSLSLFLGLNADGRFMMLKKIVLADEHAHVIAVDRLVPQLEFEDELEEPTPDPLCGRCGALIMPSGWCTNGHAPTEGFRA